MKRVGFIICILTLFVFVGLVRAQDDPTVHITKTGSKYHKAGCSYLKKSGTPVKLSEVGARYAPCSRCNPPWAIQKDKSLIRAKPANDGINENKVYTNDDLSTYTYPTRPYSSLNEKHSIEKEDETTKTDKIIYTGPRGGRYYYSPSGGKVYIKKK